MLKEVMFDSENDKLYIVMELLDYTLNDMIKGAEDGIDEEEAKEYFQQLVRGLIYCHDVAGIVHRDLKLENILFDSENVLKIADFGVSEMINS